MSFIEIKNLKKIYNANKSIEVEALKSINLIIEKGDFCSIVGVSGSGKSTLLYILGCIDKQTEGTYLLEGKNVSKMSENELAQIRNKKIGFVLQDFGLIEEETVIENVRVPILFCKDKNLIRNFRNKAEKLLKEKDPTLTIFMGGPEVSYNAREVLEKYPMAEGIMRGEGEETFAELVAYYEGRGAAELINIQGITFREKEKQIAATPFRQIMDLSKVPFVYGDIENFKNRIIYYETSRGCPFSCSYCLSSIDKCLRFRNLELVKKELQFFIDHEVPQVKFVDRTFNCKHDHAMAIWNYIKEHDKGITNFHFEVAADLLNEEEIELIRSLRPGLIQLEIGIQSTNKQTIKEINRSMNLEKVRDKVARIHEKGNVHQHLDLIAGLPYENYDSFAHSFNEVYAMEPDQFQLGFLKVLHGSVMHEKMKEYELLCQNRPPYEVLSTKWLPYSDVIRLKKVEEMVEVYYNSFQFSHTMRLLVELFPSAFSMYEKMGNYYEKKGLFGLNHSRLARYEILWDFVESELAEFTCSEKMQKKEADFKEKVLESMTLDLYLRDNVKNRPAFLGESKVEKDVASEFYKKEAEEHKYLKDYEGYDSRQLRKMTHLERLNGKLYLFDYRHRNKLNQDAAIYIIED